MVSTRNRRTKEAPKQTAKKHKDSKKDQKNAPKPAAAKNAKPAKSVKPSPPAKSDKSKAKPGQTKKAVQAVASKPKVAAKAVPKPQAKPAAPSKSASVQSKPGAAKGSSKFPQYTPAQFTEYKKLQADLDDKKLPELKDMCRQNQMKISGTKPELLERIADAKILGVIPKCPHCGGGRPKLDVKTMTYHCAGYRDDVDFVNCHKTIAYSALPRTPWQD